MKNKKALSTLLVVFMLLQMTACGGGNSGDSGGSATLKAGTYSSTQQGHNGPVDFEVTMSDSEITGVELVKGYETPGVSDKALKEYPEAIIENQSLEVDMITGATLTCAALKTAVEDAITQAGGDPEQFKKEIEKPAPEEVEKTADIIIVGGGGSGLAAAVSASEGGASVIVVEKAGYVGGNTMVSGGIYNAPDEELQGKEEMTSGELRLIEEALAEEPIDENHAALQDEVRKQLEEYKASGKTGIFDTGEWFALQTWNGGDKVADLNLVKELTYNAYDAMKWVNELGWEYLEKVNTGAGSLYPRTHRSVKDLGIGFIDAYMETLSEREQVEIIYNTEVTELVKDGAKVVGAKGTDTHGNTYTFTANKGVILSTGGFAGNKELIEEYNTTGKWPDLSSTLSTNLPAIKGDGIKLAKDAGAGFRDMDQIQLLFSCDPKNGQATHANLNTNGVGASIYVNKEGERFVREDGRRDEVSLAIMSQTDGLGYDIKSADSGFDLEKTTDLAGVPVKALIEEGSVFYGETLAEAAEAAGLPADVVQVTVDKYNQSIDDNVEKDEFGRALFSNKLENGPWAVVPRAPAVHHTMGGVVINENCQVLDESGNVIEGLFAAGEVVGGIHGGNRLGGNAIVDTVVFGKKAGEEAIK